MIVLCEPKHVGSGFIILTILIVQGFYNLCALVGQWSVHDSIVFIWVSLCWNAAFVWYFKFVKCLLQIFWVRIRGSEGRMVHFKLFGKRRVGYVLRSSPTRMCQRFYFVTSYVCRLFDCYLQFPFLCVCRPEDDHICLKHVADLN